MSSYGYTVPRRRARITFCVVGGQLAQRPGRRVGHLQRQPRARRAGHPQHPLPRVRVAELHHHLLQAQRPGARRQRPDDRAQLGQRRVHGRPHVQLDPVPVQPGQLAVGGPGRAQAVQAGIQDALELRQAGDPPGVVPDDGELAQRRPGRRAAGRRAPRGPGCGTGCTSGGAGSRVSSNPENRHTPSRSATNGCQPRWVRSSTACPSGPPRKVNQSGQPPPSPSGLRTATATRSTAGGMGPSLLRIRSARASGAPLPFSSDVWEVTYRSTSTVRPAGIAWISCGRSVAAALSSPSATVARIRYSCPSWGVPAVTSGRPLCPVTWTFRSDMIR